MCTRINAQPVTGRADERVDRRVFFIGGSGHGCLLPVGPTSSRRAAPATRSSSRPAAAGTATRPHTRTTRRPGDHLTDILTDHAIRLINEQKERPFFVGPHGDEGWMARVVKVTSRYVTFRCVGEMFNVQLMDLYSFKQVSKGFMCI